MVRLACWGLFVLSAALVLPAWAADKGDVKDKAAQDKLVAAGKFVGKLVKVEGTQRYLTVDVTVQIPTANGGAQQNLINLNRQLLDAQRIASPIDRQRRLAELQVEIEKNRRNAVSTKDEHHKVELQAADDVKVRTLILPVEYDDKGKPKRLTAKELKELKGPDPKLPGYTSDFESLKADQIVEVHLVKPKAAKGKPKEKDPDADSDKPLVSMIVIQKEPEK